MGYGKLSLNIDEIQILLQEHNLLKSSVSANQKKYSYISYDSRDVKNDTLFFCKGNFKPEYLEIAKASGATGVVAEKHLPASSGMDEYIVTDIQKALSLLSVAFYDYPQNDLFIIAVTGTKGKTTSSYLLRDAIDKASGNKTALFSTVNTVIGNKSGDTFKSQLTTPESLDVFRNMRRAVDNGMKILVMEVSSQAYLKNRVYGLKFNIGSFLNISPDHVGENEHPTFANYLHCKEQLLINSKVTIINAETKNLDDVYYAAKATCNPENVYLFARNGAKTEIPVTLDFVFDSKSDTLSDNEIYLKSLTKKGEKLNLDGNYRIGIPGDYNEANATDAIIAAGLAGFKRTDLLKGIADTKIPGRMEMYSSQDHGTVYVDYAHNYASTRALLGFLKRQNPNGRVVAVVGSPGNKGIDRREGFGKALNEEADVAYLTTDDPAYENPQKIAQEIDSYIDHDKVDVHFNLDREQAIKDAILSGKKEDIIVILGKGQDPYQKVKGIDIPYPTDSAIVKKIVESLNQDTKN
ncbi:UDP-N-acetylmuramoylalanyl-D-glutamate--2,6-diaminopimelate ligase [Fructilactobacillus lindneri DSM 20690 = JCM 11027]|uniref:UDP-N-acetylmuramoyl-L-alanyl-D-glutamate--L-lysine ligase n=1 Tax=Fructilactobacillus lindneri DSM 20690 = JCM 11027 TaxID=1122148 RepID=A0A0R2JPR5_9LACO|nr:UDP-N-acetylmuramoyl-L-alanyl-D-glutamate--2,6-diaminopimelate ligase [Fructilactobacillus lindneri]KRN79122.1 UDP-N-acetylmuramoylalanyl-D-glutamate--2,6-diaminopimelate ligase [Fructilactobacillus lindneri DSM 20690 = JCM 11027]SJZ74805.1 UDP-N-acetylmuramoylalanyl-D-glutamate--2,6-diaminopimelate ligase [Fructilactobacillus lindneri DSM 20690 = JCM 11027]